MKWFLIFGLLAIPPAAAQAAPQPPPLPACTPSQVRDWPIVDENTLVQGRTIVIRQEPNGTRRCGTVKISGAKPSQSAPKKVK